MKTPALWLCILIGMLSLMAGCSVKPDEQAQGLYAEASRQLQSVNAETASYTEALTAYRKAKSNIDRLLTDYPSNSIATGLRSGQIQIAGDTLVEFKVLGTTLAQLAEAEQNPIATALMVAQIMKEHVGFQGFLPAESIRKFAEIGMLHRAIAAAKTIEDHNQRAEVMAAIADRFLSKKAGNVKGYLLADLIKQYAETGPLAQALEAAKTIENQNYRAEVMALIADQYIEAKQPKAAERLLADALATVHMQDAHWLPGTFDSVDKYVQIGHLEQALAIVQALVDIGLKDKGLAVVAGAYAKAGQVGRSFEISRIIGNEDAKAYALMTITEQYAETEQLHQALEIAQTLKHRDTQSKTLTVIAAKYAQAGQTEKATNLFSQALGIAQTIEDERSKAMTYIHIAQHAQTEWLQQVLQVTHAIHASYGNAFVLWVLAGQYQKSGQIEMAEKLYAEADEILGNLGLESDNDAHIPLAVIASAYGKIGQLNRALEIAFSIHDVGHADEFMDDTFAKIVDRFAKAGKLKKVFETAKAFKFSGEYENDIAKIFISRAIIQEYAKAGQFAQALEIAKIVPEDKDYSYKSGVLKIIAEHYAETGQFAQALAIAQTIEVQYIKADTLLIIVDQYAKVGHFEQVLTLINAAHDAEFENYFKDEALTTIAKRYAEAGKFTDALAIGKTQTDGWQAQTLFSIVEGYAKAGQFTQALKIARTMQESKSGALAVIAEQYARAGKFTKALKVTQTIPREDEKSETLAVIAEQYAKAGHFAKALKVARTIQRADDKSGALALIAEQYAKAGQLNQALGIIQTIQKPDQKLKALTAITARHVDPGLLAKILEITESIPIGSLQSEAFSVISKQSAEAGHFTQVLTSVQNIDGDYQKAQALAAIADRAVKTGYAFNENDKAILRAIIQAAMPLKNVLHTEAIRQ